MRIKNVMLFVVLFVLIVSCKTEHQDHHDDNDHDEIHLEHDKEISEKSVKQLKTKLLDEGYQIFDYIDEKTGDTVLMQQYFIAFLKRGPSRSQSKEEADSLQSKHLAHLGEMYDKGFADISGPFGDDGDIRGITIYNVPSLKMADSLANSDPMVKAGRLIIEMHPWWAAKGFSLR